MTGLPERNFRAMGAAAIKAADTSGWIAILPLGATEQHGPHLPPETDWLIAQAISGRLAAALPKAVPATFLPVEKTGYSPEHLDFAATKSLTHGQAVGRWRRIGAQLANLGIRKLILLNAHGGNAPLMTIVATELRISHAMLCVATSWTRFVSGDDIVSDAEKSFGIHGGEIETSVMLAIAPDRVAMAKARDFASFQNKLFNNYKYLRAYGPHAFGWKIQDLNEVGAVGNAAAATAAKGEALIAAAVEGLARLVREVDRFDIARIDKADAKARRAANSAKGR